MEKIIEIKDILLPLIEEKKFSAVKAKIMEMNCADIAGLFNEMPVEIIPRIFRLLPKESAADTFVEMESDLQELLIKAFSDKELHDVLTEIFVDDAVDIIEEMPANVVKRILKQAEPEMRNDINKLLKYPENSAGSVMTTEFVELKGDISAEKAIQHIRKTAIDKETVNTCYITTNDRVLIGSVTLRSLILANQSDIISDIMEYNPIYVTTEEDQEKIATLFGKYNLLAMPVVDNENRLVGIVTVDDVLDIIEEETTEDIAKMAAILPSDKSYFKTSVLSTVKSRIPWLLLLMISATFTGIIISSFESKLTLFPALIAFIPMLMDTAGNSGSQASVTIIRAISLGEVNFRNILRVMWKELRVSIICAVLLSFVNFFKIWLIDITILNRMATLTDAFIVCITLLFTIIIAKLVGCTLPLLASKLKFDPAVMASPFITTLIDAVSLLVYFKVAQIVMGII